MGVDPGRPVVGVVVGAVAVTTRKPAWPGRDRGGKENQTTAGLATISEITTT